MYTKRILAQTQRYKTSIKVVIQKQDTSWTQTKDIIHIINHTIPIKPSLKQLQIKRKMRQTMKKKRSMYKSIHLIMA